MSVDSQQKLVDSHSPQGVGVDPEEYDGNPNDGLSGSQFDQIHRLVTRISQLESVHSGREAVNESINGVATAGGVELAVQLADGYTQADLQEEINRLRFDVFCAAEVVPYVAPSEGRMNPEDVDAGINLYQHPLRSIIAHALHRSRLYEVAEGTINWQPNTSRLNQMTRKVDWEAVAPVEFTLSVEVPVENIRAFKSYIKQLAPTKGAPQYITSISERSVSETVDGDGDPIRRQSNIEIGYEQIRPSPIDSGKMKRPTNGFTEPDTTGETDQTDSDTADTPMAAILQGNSENLPTGSCSSSRDNPLADRIATVGLTEKFQLTVTSPVYLDAICYEDYEGSETRDYSGNSGDGVPVSSSSASTEQLLDAWKQQQKDIFSAVYNATKPGGYCAVVIGRTKTNGEMVDLPAHFSTLMRSSNAGGWNLEQKITWHKLTGDKSYGTTIQTPHPGYYRPNQNIEQILVFRKGKRVLRDSDMATFRKNEFMKKEVANNMWTVPPVPPSADIEHPCPYPAELARRLIRLYSYPSETVFDPMAGAGTTVRAAYELGVRCLGIELRSKFVREARRQTFVKGYDQRPQKILNWEEVSPDDAQIIERGDGNLDDDLSRYQ